MRKRLAIAGMILILQSTAASGVTACNVTCVPKITNSSVKMGTFNPYDYVNSVTPVRLMITCSGNMPADECSKETSVAYIYEFVSNNANGFVILNADSHIKYQICTNPTCSNANGRGGKVGVTNDYTFIPKIGRTDSFIFYFVLPVQPLAVPKHYLDSVRYSFEYKVY